MLELFDNEIDSLTWLRKRVVDLDSHSVRRTQDQTLLQIQAMLFEKREIRGTDNPKRTL